MILSINFILSLGVAVVRGVATPVDVVAAGTDPGFRIRLSDPHKHKGGSETLSAHSAYFDFVS